MQNLDNYINYIAYAAGFATGNFVGMIIEERLAMRVYSRPKSIILFSPSVISSGSGGRGSNEGERARM